MSSGSSPKDGSPRRLAYRVRALDGTWRSRDGNYTSEGSTWSRLSHLRNHRSQIQGWRGFRAGDRVVEFEMVEVRNFSVEELDR